MVAGERRDAVQRGSQFSLKEMLAQQPAAEPQRREEPATKEAEPVPPLDELSPLPGPGTPYTAYARASNKPLPSLVLLMPDASVRGFSYANLDTLDLLPASDPGQGPVIVARFSGVTAAEVRISGRRLDALYNYLGHHRTAWIRVRPEARDFLDEGTVITGIAIKKIEG
jgi:hypothetical protein